MRTNNRITKKCQRWDIPGHAHELTFSCYHNHKFFLNRSYSQWLVESIGNARDKYNFSLWAYVFMPDHIHLLIRPKEKYYSISKILSTIKRPVGRKIISHLKSTDAADIEKLRTGWKGDHYRFWQKGGGYDRNITRTDTLSACVRYIHRNPVRKKLAASPEDWYFSSAAVWANIREGPLVVDRDDWPVFT